jgi:hypothetical protein
LEICPGVVLALDQQDPFPGNLEPEQGRGLVEQDDVQ